MSRVRDLVYNFANLSISTRREILLDLGLLTLDEYRAEMQKRSFRDQHMLAFRRARERGLVEKLAEAVAQKKGRG